MSLIAPLLSLPGRLRKLRGHNAHKMPSAESIAPVLEARSICVQIEDNTEARCVQPYETHGAWTNLPDNAAQASFNVCDITGKGVCHGIWLACSDDIAGGTFGIFGMSAVVDGVELIDQTWRFDTRLNNLSVNRSFRMVPFLGGVATREAYLDLTQRFRYLVNTPLLSPLPFSASLKIDLIHYESEALSGAVDLISARGFAAIYETE